jgi:succinate dehydrogenase/fumarate reductase flavoprotein subunit
MGEALTAARALSGEVCGMNRLGGNSLLHRRLSGHRGLM